MTDAQFNALLVVLGGGLTAVAAAIRWSVTRGVKAMDRGADALVANTASSATLATKIDGMSAKLDNVDGFVRKAPSRSEVEALVSVTVEKEISGVHEAAGFETRTQLTARPQPPPGQYGPKRPGTSGR